MNTINDIKKNGYSKISGIFENDKEILFNKTRTLLEEKSFDYKTIKDEPKYDYVSNYDIRRNIFTFFKTVNRNFLGCDQKLDNILINYLTTKKLKIF